MENKDNYFAYVDESNISAATGTSAYCAVFVFSSDKASLGKMIACAENKLGIRYLHWVDMPWKLRVKFAEEIKKLNFVCKVVLYKNPINHESALEDFIIKLTNIGYVFDKIIIDGSKNHFYIHRLKKKLRSKGAISLKLMFIDDKVDPLVRLADFIAGLVRSYVDKQNKDNAYMFNALKFKIKIPD